MAVRLQMKLGVVAENERLQDSPDVVAVVEPTIGATARSKGSLFLVVSGIGRGRKLREATSLVAEAIQSEYYYDESAGLVVCLEKAIRNANRRLAAVHEKFGFPEAPSGPIGIGVAVVRGNELYVVTSGPVEAYLIRQAHLLTLPDADRENGLPHDDTAPDVWRGEVTAGDTLVLVSSNVTSTLGIDELKDAVVTLHPQAAVEQIHQRFRAAAGSGSDGLLALEAREVSSTTKSAKLTPAKPAEPLAGQPDRSPIPLADSVAGGAAAAATAATSARSAAGGALSRFVNRVQDILPRRGGGYRRVTPPANRRDAQRRGAIAILAFLAVAAVIAVVFWSVPNNGGGRVPVARQQDGEKALNLAKADVATVFDSGTDLIAADPGRAQQLLTDAYTQLGVAEKNGILASTTGPIRTRVVAGLDRSWGVIEIDPGTAFTFSGKNQTFDLRSLVIGPDGAPYALDFAGKTVYRIDVRTRKAQVITRDGAVVGGQRVGAPKLLGLGGPDVLILDDKNALWRWRPADNKGTGTIRRIPIVDSTLWGNDVLGFATLTVNADQGQYNLYVVDASEQQIRKYVMVADGSGYSGQSTPYFTTARDVSKVTSVYIDGELFLADGGSILQFSAGRTTGWRSGSLPDTLLRPTVSVTQITSPDQRGEGNLYAFDRANSRLLAFDKTSGDYVAQYRLPDGADWSALGAFAVVRAASGSVLYWTEGATLRTAILRGANDGPSASPNGSPGPSGSAGSSASPGPSASGSPAPSTKPGKSPAPTKSPKPTRSP